MINEKIQHLLEELQKECEKEKVAVLCTANKGGDTITMLVGNLIDMAVCLAVQEINLDNRLPLTTDYLRDAGLVALRKLKRQVAKDKPNHTFMVDDLNDLPEMLNNILRGDYK